MTTQHRKHALNDVFETDALKRGLWPVFPPPNLCLVYLRRPTAGFVLHTCLIAELNNKTYKTTEDLFGDPNSPHKHLLRASKCEFKAAINLPDSSGLWRRPDSAGLNDT